MKTLKEQEKDARMIVLISSVVEKARQKMLKKIIKRLDTLSANDIESIARIMNLK